MTIIVNSQPKDLKSGATVESLVIELGLEKHPCAVEVNRQLVPKKKHPLHTLAEGDVVEIVTLVGGG